MATRKPARTRTFRAATGSAGARKHATKGRSTAGARAHAAKAKPSTTKKTTSSSSAKKPWESAKFRTWTGGFGPSKRK